jgi:hypothetical protein
LNLLELLLFRRDCSVVTFAAVLISSHHSCSTCNNMCFFTKAIAINNHAFVVPIAGNDKVGDRQNRKHHAYLFLKRTVLNMQLFARL